MPPKHEITFYKGSTEITFQFYCSKKDLENLGYQKLRETVINPLEFKIKK